LKNFSRMKRWWWEELQLPVTIKRSVLSSKSLKIKKFSSDIGSLDAFRSKFFAKVISYVKSFSLNEYYLRILSSVFLIEIFDLLGKELKYAENSFWIITENPYKFWSCRTCVGRVKTVVTNHLRKMFRSNTQGSRRQYCSQDKFG